VVLGSVVSYVDDDHVLWYVEEHDARGVPGNRGERCLLFASEGVVRRVWDYPADWRDLVPVALSAMSWRR
jgi:hypothetical protein